MLPQFLQGDGIRSKIDFLSEINQMCLQYQDELLVTTNKRTQYYNLPAAFDIEVSSFYDGEKESENKRAIMYCWQFGIFNKVVMGRTWDEFISFLSVLQKAMGLSNTRRLAVYVHNLPYEFQFIRKRIKWEKVFLLDERKPVYAISNYGIEFRCSLKLAGGKSLANVANDLVKYPVQKMVGFLDYNVLRTPLTPLSTKELKYCENDIRVILSYIQEKIEQDGDITRIPLTNTGYVRNYCRKECYAKWKPYRKIMDQLTIEPDEYSQLKEAFQGGFVHANPKYTNQPLENVGSHDFGSSYPAVMVTEKFPMSKGVRINRHISEKEFIDFIKHNCCLFEIEYDELLPTLNQDHPISSSKCKKLLHPIIHNGRVVEAEKLTTVITEQDFITYSQFYHAKEYHISRMLVYEKNYLPRQFVKAILQLYERKTKLKGVAEEVINYMISKNMINAAYGMTVTDIVRDVLDYLNNKGYTVEKGDVVELIETYNKNIRRFLYYPWGVWVTAYARRNLFTGIVELGNDYVYADTDSTKSLNTSSHQQYFDDYNKKMVEKIQRAAEYQRLDLSLFSPKDSKGNLKTIGLWEDEGIFDKFKTLGAKRYITFRNEKQKIKDGDLEIQLTVPTHVLTVAGVNKARAMAWLRTTGKPFDNFQSDLVVPKDRSGRIIMTYIDDEMEGDIIGVDGQPYHYHELSSVHMENSEYNLSVVEDYIRFIEEVVDISE